MFDVAEDGLKWAGAQAEEYDQDWQPSTNNENTMGNILDKVKMKRGDIGNRWWVVLWSRNSWALLVCNLFGDPSGANASWRACCMLNLFRPPHRGYVVWNC